MFNVSICEYFSVLNVFIVCIRNTARSKSIPLLYNHVDSYKFRIVHPPREYRREEKGNTGKDEAHTDSQPVSKTSQSRHRTTTSLVFSSTFSGASLNYDKRLRRTYKHYNKTLPLTATTSTHWLHMHI
jgi:hypothetical protein